MHRSRFFTAVKLPLLNVITSLITRRTISSHDLRKNNHLGESILCVIVHFQPVIKSLQKGVRVHRRRVILMQNAIFSFPRPVGRGTPSPHTPHPSASSVLNPRAFGASILTPSILKAAYATDTCLNAYICGLQLVPYGVFIS